MKRMFEIPALAIIFSVSLVLTLAFASRSYPAPLAINIFETQYTTSLYSQWEDGPLPHPGLTTKSQTMVSTVPISDSMYDSWSGHLWAEANAGLFGISAFATYGAGPPPFYYIENNNASASAKSEIWFSPLTSGTTTINIQFTGQDHWFWSQGFVSLLDVTSGHESWNHGWSSWPTMGTAVPWVWNPGPQGTATLILDTDFIAADKYELSMYTNMVSSDNTAGGILIQLSGLTPVPEPSTMLLLGSGMIGLVGLRKKLRK